MWENMCEVAISTEVKGSLCKIQENGIFTGAKAAYSLVL